MNVEQISVIQADITTLSVDAVVNSANRSLLGGGGVDRAIHRAAGRELLLECMTLEGCPVGESRITNAYALPCKKVIHTVGPVWLGGGSGEEEALRSCWQSAMALCRSNGLRSVAFPAVSGGIHRYPRDLAAETALQVLLDVDYDGEVILCMYTEEDRAAYADALEKARRKVLRQPL